MALRNDKSLGQHWLTNRAILAQIADAAKLGPTDTVLEIGPGLGTLTSELLRRAGKVVAVEFDPQLAAKLPGQFPGKNLQVIHQDILSYPLESLPDDFVVVGNIPYYITNKIVRKVSEGPHRPKTVVLLIQKEVAERLAAQAGDLSVSAIAAQVNYRVECGIGVPAEYFTPPPKVDSAVVVMMRRAYPLVPIEEQAAFLRIVKAGFSAPRKKLRSSLAGGLGMEKPAIESLLRAADVSPDARAEQLSIQAWLDILHALPAR